MSDSIVLVSLHVRQSPQAVPLSAATIAASLPSSWYSRTRLLDFFPEDSDEAIVEQIVAADPVLVGFSLYVWNRQRVVTLARFLRRRRPQLPLLVGGPEATANTTSLNELQLFDRVCEGEGELVFTELVAAVDQQRDLAAPSLVQDGPVDMERQISPWLSQQIIPGSGVLWEVSRGCPFSCSFCYDARGEHGVRVVPQRRLEQELQLFVRHGVSQVWVLDSTFNFPAERGRKLLQLIAEIAPHIHFHLEAKAEYLDEETVELLQQISCSVQLGLQSARPEVLRHIQRALDPQLFQHKIELLAEAGITFGIDLMYGLPTDDYQGLCDSLEFVLALRPNQVEIFPLAVLPGTRLYQQREQFGLQAELSPPYQLLSSDTMTPAQLNQCRHLAAVTDLFYNTGRSMAYFLDLCQGYDLTPLQLLNRFGDWLATEQQIDDEQLLATDWTASQATTLQLAFIEYYLRQTGQENLLPVSEDMIRFHRIWADTILAEEVVGKDSLPATEQWLQQCWQLAAGVTVAHFHYDVQEYYFNPEVDLVEMAEFHAAQGSNGLFFRRHNEVACLAIEAELTELLRGCDGSRTPQQIVETGQLNVAPQQLEEWIELAVSEGVLQPVSA
ncbi:MAG: DUF4080 domain-containing protein [Desulfuromonas sp.]|nr:DUF4080 domain-containing protein [Desulfuromonas sp.]